MIEVFDFLGAVGIAFPGLDKTVQLRGIDTLDRAFDLNAAELVLLTLFNCDGDRIVVGCWIKISRRRDDAEIRITAVVVEPAQRFFVGAQAGLRCKRHCVSARKADWNAWSK